MKLKKHIYAVIMSVILIIPSIMPIYAEYENTYKNTGDNVKDIIGVALTQIGYTEGINDDTKYGKWYGLNNNPWCAMFVSWCANEAGIPKTVIPSHASCDVGMNWFIKHNLFEKSPYYGGDYVPVPGDIVYFGTPEDSTHVGIVYKVNDSIVTTIEGNSAAKVQTVNYKKGSAYIIGYGTPDYSEKEYGYTVGNYTTTADLLNIRAQATTDSRIIAQVAKGTILTITDFSGKWGKTEYDGKSGWVFMTYCEKSASTVKFDASGGKNAPDGIKKYENEGVDLPEIIPTKDGYTFLGWSTDKDACRPEYIPGDRLISDTVFTLYALWQPDISTTKVEIDGNGSYYITEKDNTVRIYIKAADNCAVSYLTLDGIQQILISDSNDYLIEITDKSNHTVNVSISENSILWLNPFNDISESSWCYAPIGYCYNHGYFKGKSDVQFAPGDYILRKNAVLILGKIYEAVSGNKIPDVKECDFADVVKGSYYEKYVQWAFENGIAGGTGGNNFGIDATVTRAQIVLMLKNLESLLGNDVSYDTSLIENVSDLSDAGEWAIEGLTWAVTKGLMSVQSGIVNPKGNATRAQIAQMIYNLYR